MKRFVSILLILALAVSLIGCGGQKPAEQKKITWKFGHLGNEEHPWQKTALKFAELVKAKTNGQIEITVFPNEQLGKEVDVLNMIKTGTADLTISGESMQNWAPKAALMAVPYAFRDTQHMVSVIKSDLGKEIAADITDKVGVTPIYYHLRSPRNLTSNKPIRSLADLKGLKMRVPNVPLFVEAWKAAGANPQVMAFSEVFTALQQNVIGGQENPYDLINSAGFYEVQKYVNETEHVHGWIYVVIGNQQLNSLTPELKKAVLEAAAEAQVFGNELFNTQTAAFKQAVKDKGMIIVEDVNKAEFQKAMEPAVKGFLNADQFNLYERIVNFK